MKKKSLLLTAVTTLGLTAATMAQNVPSYVPTNGLVGWWPFNGNANDESGNGNNGTVNGATLSTDRFGTNNSCYDYNNSTNDYISYGDISGYGTNNAFSISAWFNYNQIPSPPNDWFTVVGDGSYSDPNGFGIIINDGQILFRNNNSFGVLVGTNLSINLWYNIVGVYESDSVKVYLNGFLIGSSAHQNSNIFNTNLHFKSGKCDDVPIDPNDHEYFFNGKLDDIGLWNRALTQQEITDLYNGNICYQTITVTDTLLINMGITGYNPVTYNNTIKIFPNPTNDHITIDYGNFASLSGYQLKIENSLGQQVFQTSINQQSNYLSLSNWGGNGLYFVRIIDPLGNTIDIRKIVLQ